MVRLLLCMSRVLIENKDTVIYLSGRHIVEYDIIRKKQSFITKSIEDEAVTSMAYYRSKKNVLKVAVGLKGNSETLPQVWLLRVIDY